MKPAPASGTDKESTTKIRHYLHEPLEAIQRSVKALIQGKRRKHPHHDQILEGIAHQVSLLSERVDELLWMTQIGISRTAPLLAPETEAASPREKPAPAVEPRASILVVDDDPVTVAFMEGVLVSEGYRVLTANDATQAVDQARLHQPDLITMDLNMPQVQGKEIIRVLREDPETRDIPIVVLSGNVEQEQVMELPVDGFLTKPVDEGRLFRTLSRIIASRTQKPDRRRSVLVVDDSLSVVRILTHMLQELGYSTMEAYNGTEALSIALKRQPNLIILDYLLHPSFDGLEVLKRLKAGQGTNHIPVILLSATDTPEEKARGFRLGADDFIVKPFSPLELGARIEAILKRAEMEYIASPTTRLPGNIAIERILAQRIEDRAPLAVCYCDLDNFKAYNDAYGFFKGDGVIRQTARILMDCVKAYGNAEDFIGHIGGDDFVIITTPDRVDTLCQRIIETFDRLIPLHYDEAARRRGYIEEKDRQGRRTRFPIMSLSMAVVTNAHREITHAAEVADIAAELKRKAKKIAGSVYVKDRRRP